MKPIVAQAAAYYVMSSMYVGSAMQLADNKKSWDQNYSFCDSRINLSIKVTLHHVTPLVGFSF